MAKLAVWPGTCRSVADQSAMLLSSRCARVPGHRQRFKLFGKSDQAVGSRFRSRGFRHLPVFACPFAKLACRQEIQRHIIWHQTLPFGPVAPDLFAATATLAGPLVTVNAWQWR
jgi:hypothetical protein